MESSFGPTLPTRIVSVTEWKAPSLPMTIKPLNTKIEVLGSLPRIGPKYNIFSCRLLVALNTGAWVHNKSYPRVKILYGRFCIHNILSPTLVNPFIRNPRYYYFYLFFVFCCWENIFFAFDNVLEFEQKEAFLSFLAEKNVKKREKNGDSSLRDTWTE